MLADRAVALFSLVVDFASVQASMLAEQSTSWVQRMRVRVLSFAAVT
jgi:hypothetical protein